MEETLEIRKLQPSHIKKLSEILDFDDNWKLLMDKIPKQLQRENFTCADNNNVPKYNDVAIGLIDKAAKTFQKSCTEILLDEWGTSGRIRPTLGHFRYILQKAKLYTADSYVAVHILKKPPLSRPSTGPAAKILFSDFESEDLDAERINSEFIEPLENDENIPDFSLINASEPPTGNAIESPTGNARQIDPNISTSSTDVVSDSSTDVKSAIVSDQSVPNNVVTDGIGTVEAVSPRFSELLANSGSSPSSKQIINNNREQPDSSFDIGIPQISELLVSNNIDEEKLESHNTIPMTPDFSELMSSNNTEDTDSNRDSINSPKNTTDNYLESTDVSESNNTSNNRTNSHITSLSDLIPQFSELISQPQIISASNELTKFSYYDILNATDNFVRNSDKCLGSGRLGQVNLATDLNGISEKVVAVKKFNTQDPDCTEKSFEQFKKDIDILCKYKHENLISLLGYSIDGPTFCLIMEYMTGNSLRRNIEVTDKKLLWNDRLKVALHISKGIQYLHTAFETPLVHGNLSSLNILLDKDNNAKLSDFGLTFPINTESVYVSPEATAPNFKPSVKLDIYSYGVLLLELLTSLPPENVSGQDGRDLVTHITEVCKDNDITCLLDITVGTWQGSVNNIGQELFDIALKCLAEEPKKRGYIEYVNEQINKLFCLANP